MQKEYYNIQFNISEWDNDIETEFFVISIDTYYPYDNAMQQAINTAKDVMFAKLVKFHGRPYRLKLSYLPENSACWCVIDTFDLEQEVNKLFH